MPRTRRSDTDPLVTEGYSMRESLHDRIRQEAYDRDISRSEFVRRAVRFYLDSLDVARRVKEPAS